MSKQRTFKLRFDDEVVFTIQIEGSDSIVDRLINDIWFNSALRDATADLIKNAVKQKIKS